ncbi:MAG: NAD-dependent epimerase/dehydratase family protein [Thaumarchaeota archaeon]|nr:NAD-dependent epimerase/dehydratase family protein [Nitrososphaerota archaeon]
MARRRTKILVVGSTGQVGSELTPALRRRYGFENVIAGWHTRPPTPSLREGPTVRLDAMRRSDVERVVRKFDVDSIYHLGVVLSAVGEKSPERAWTVNIDGLRNVLEAARKNGVPNIFWPSSMAVFGKGAPRDNTPQDAPLLPSTIYGVTKVAGELLCNYYFGRFGLDVRSLRFPGIISSETPPGGGTTDYAVEIFYEAIRKERYTCFLKPETTLPMMYMPDCVKATVQLMESAASKIKVRTSYNVTGMSFSASKLAKEIRTHIPEFKCNYRVDFRQAIADSWPRSMDDSAARSDWGWYPEYNLSSMTKEMLARVSDRLK